MCGMGLTPHLQHVGRLSFLHSLWKQSFCSSCGLSVHSAVEFGSLTAAPVAPLHVSVVPADDHPPLNWEPGSAQALCLLKVTVTSAFALGGNSRSGGLDLLDT